MNDLLHLAVSAQGGLERWSRVKSISANLTISGQLLQTKGYPGHWHVNVTVAPDHLHTVFESYPEVGMRGICEADRVWIENAAGQVVSERHNPRAAFAGHTRETKWDQLHHLHFFGYALWNYLTTPFIFTRPGFEIQELETQVEDGEQWRVLEVRFPTDIPAHCEVQRFYFSAEGVLKRLDYTTDVLGGVAAHYLYDSKWIDGLLIAQLRRVVQRKPTGPKLTGLTAFLLDFLNIEIHDRAEA
jgi:hypothetical protein